ncbi:hypothetical protein [Sneathiella sp.]|jgi:hypothetical protein|uniref:hypothetical protein n=1 Tax=Sneathiella sp. TaxID=1964365 RepID=UPI0039E33003
MTSSRSKRAALAFAIFGMAPFLYAADLKSQEKPRSLVPDFSAGQNDNKKAGSRDAPSILLPGTGTNPSNEISSERRTKGDGTLVIETLDALGPGSAGTLGVEQGGLGNRMWDGSPPRRVAALLSRLPSSVESPAAKDLYRRLLLTGAALNANDPATNGIVTIRLNKLVEAGMHADALALAGRIQQEDLPLAAKKHVAEASLLSGDLSKSCTLASELTQRGDVDMFWAKLDSFCLITAGALDKAELSVALLEERGIDDPLFFSLFSALASGTPPKGLTLEDADALHIAMAMAAKIEGPENNTEQTYQAGFDRLAAATAAEAKVEILKELWNSARVNGDFVAISAKSMDALKTIPPTTYGFEFDLTAVQVFLLFGEEVRAAEWERVIRRGASQGSNTERLQGRKNVLRLDSYILFSGIQGIARWNNRSFAAWLNATRDLPDQGEKATFLVSLMEVLGYPISSEDWESLLLLPLPLVDAYSNHGLERNLVAAASDNRVGETVALALLAMEDKGPSEVTTTTMVAVTSALLKVGLEKEARRLVLEAAISKEL